MDWVGQQKGMRLTPREGLRIGLERADFRLARTFAQQVLLSDPENTRANFAMGMGYFVPFFGILHVIVAKTLFEDVKPAAMLPAIIPAVALTAVALIVSPATLPE